MRKRNLLIVLALVFLLPISLLVAQRRYLERVEETFDVSSDTSLEVMLDVDAGEVFVERGGAARSGTILLRFTRGEFRHRIDFDEEKNRLKVDLKKRSWFGKSSYDRNTRAKLEIALPQDVDMYFDAKVKAGEVLLEMGGLRLKEFCLDNLAGEVEVRFDDPNPIVMEMMDVNVKAGEMSFVSLGNARFEKADINGGVGELTVDFTGDLLDGSMAKVDLDIGEASIYVPDGIGIRMEIGGGFSFLSHKDIDGDFYKRGRVYYSEDYDEREERFALRITPGLGELNVERE